MDAGLMQVNEKSVDGHHGPNRQGGQQGSVSVMYDFMSAKLP